MGGMSAARRGRAAGETASAEVKGGGAMGVQGSGKKWKSGERRNKKHARPTEGKACVVCDRPRFVLPKACAATICLRFIYNKGVSGVWRISLYI